MIPETRPNDWGQIAERLLEHLEHGTTDSAPEVMQVPVADYVDATRWDTEVDTLFRRSPVVVALSAHLREPGAYRSIDVVGVPVLSVRQPDGTVRAFVNVCRHRGAQVVGHGCGTARRFACPYHAWTYDGTGALVGIAGRSTFGELDLAARGLAELPCEERYGMVFAICDPAATPEPRWLDAWLAGYGPVLDSLGLDTMAFLDERELTGPNWKIAYDGYVDSYHLDILHRDTLGKDVIGNVMTCDAWGPHQRLAFARRNTAELRDIARDEWRPGRHIAMVHTVFPHVSVAGNGGSAVMVSQLFPGPTPDRSRTIQTHLVVDGIAEDAREAALARADLLEWVVTEEDYKTGLGIQAGLTSGANTEFVFGRNEPGNQRFHQWVADLVAQD